MIPFTDLGNRVNLCCGVEVGEGGGIKCSVRIC